MSRLRKHLVPRAALLLAHYKPMPGSPYRGMEDFLLDRGTAAPVAQLTEEQVKYLEATMKASGFIFRPRQCFANAQMAVWYDTEGRLTYMEGFALSEGIGAIHHAWVVIDCAAVAEVTWRALDAPSGSPPLLQPAAGAEYLGVEISREQIGQRLLNDGWLGTFFGGPVCTLFHQERLQPVADDVRALADALTAVRGAAP